MLFNGCFPKGIHCTATPSEVLTRRRTAAQGSLLPHKQGWAMPCLLCDNRPGTICFWSIYWIHPTALILTRTVYSTMGKTSLWEQPRQKAVSHVDLTFPLCIPETFTPASSFWSTPNTFKCFSLPSSGPTHSGFSFWSKLLRVRESQRKLKGLPSRPPSLL